MSHRSLEPYCDSHLEITVKYNDILAAPSYTACTVYEGGEGINGRIVWVKKIPFYGIALYHEAILAKLLK